MNGLERGKLLKAEIEAAREREEETRRPNGLRPSELGHECTRYLYLRYRWMDELQPFSGRLLRLFETGHLQEDRLADDLRRVGAIMHVKDPDDAKKQISMKILDGHCNGFLDGVGEHIPHASARWILTEMKTHSKASFAQLEKHGVQGSQPKHYAQCQLYMNQHNLPEALYIAVNKDNDELYCEFIEYDERYAESLISKARMIIYSDHMPEKISRNPTFFKCKFCTANAVCHSDAKPEPSCRSCVHGKPIPNKEASWALWECQLHGHDLDLQEQRDGCPDHDFIIVDE